MDGANIGSFSISGDTLTVPFLSWCIPIGKSNRYFCCGGFTYALFCALAYAINTQGVSNLPADTIGYIYWSAVIAMILMSFLTAPIGAVIAISFDGENGFFCALKDN